MRILFLTDNFPPETNAPATRTHEHTRRWVRAGHEVTVVTGVPNFPSGRIHAGYRNRPWQSEMMDGVRVVRVWTYVAANAGVVRRTVDYLSYMVAAVLAGVMLPRPDVIVATSPQFFTALAGCMVGMLRRRPYVFELRDLWPDSISAVGALRESRTLRLLRRVEYWLYRRAALIVSVTHSFREILTRNGIPGSKIVVVPNGVDPDGYTPGPRPPALEARLGLQGKFVAAYVGTIGMAHGLDTILAAAERLRARTDIAFVLVGTGAEHAQLEAKSRQRGLDNVLFVGAVGKAEVKEYWRLCDVALVLLRDLPLFRHVIPSKIFEAWGTGRPVLLGVRGESAGIVQAADGGVIVPPESPDELADAIRRMADDPQATARAGLRGREFVEREYDRDDLAQRMLEAVLSMQRSRDCVAAGRPGVDPQPSPLTPPARRR